ncbi:Protein ASP-7 [Aphelenchoides avenae]|nr:Protein ASP-7 [Aphelenchus avenae]
MGVYDPYVTTCPKILPADGDTRGVDATDDVLIANTRVKSVKFNAIEQIFGIATPEWPDAGILGMVWQDFFRDYSSLMMSVTNVFDYYDEKQGRTENPITIFVDKNDSAPIAGVLTIGSNNDSSNCEENWNVISLDTVDLISWNVRLDNFYFGSIRSYGAQLSFTIEPHIGITEDIFSDVISNLGAWVDPDTGDYTLPCNVSDSAAGFVFEMGGASYNVSAKDFIRNEMPVRNNGMCTLFLKNTLEPAEGMFGWYVGVPFLRNVCVSLDYGWKTIYLANVKRK